MATQGVRLKRDQKVPSGPKLRPNAQHSPPGTPPALLSLLDSFSALKAELRSNPLPERDSKVSDVLSLGAGATGAKGRATTKRQKGDGRGQRDSKVSARTSSNVGDLESAKAILKTLEADGVQFSQPIPLLGEEDAVDEGVAVRSGSGPRSHSVPPPGARETTTVKDQRPRANLEHKKSDLRQQHAHFDDEEYKETSPREKRKPVSEEERAEVQANIHDALKWAEALLLGPKTFTRVENVRYNGSVPLTFPSVQRKKGEAFELEEVGTKTYDKRKWEEHAKARAAGVTAMEQLLQRYHKLKDEKASGEEEMVQYKNQIQKHISTIKELREQAAESANEQSKMQKKLAKADQQRDKDKQEQSREILRMQDTLRTLREKCDALNDEKESMAYSLSDAETLNKKHTEAIATLKKEINEKNTKENADAHRIASLVQENARLALVNEGLEHELELLDEDFAYAKMKLKSAQQYVERVTKDHHEKMKLLNEKLSSRLYKTEEALQEKTSGSEELERKLAESEEKLAFFSERAAVLEAELKTTKEQSHDASHKLKDALAELHSAQTKNKWSWLINLSLVLHAFPHNADKICQTDGSVSTDMGTMTDFRTSDAEFVRFWSEVLRAADKIDLKGAQNSLKMPVQELFAFISQLYTRKTIADIVDDTTHYPKSTMQEFLFTHFVEVTGDKESALKAVATLVANIVFYCSLGATAKMKAAPEGGKGGTKASAVSRPAATSQDKDVETSILLISLMPRLLIFAKFLGVGPDIVEPLPLDGLCVYLGCLLKIKKGQYPLLPLAAERVTVSSAECMDSIDYVLAKTKSHERMAIKNHFAKDVSMGKANVDLDTALSWIVTRWMENVFDRTDERLRSIFVSADSDGDGNLDFDEYFGMLKKLRSDQRELLPLPQLVRIYSRMMLGSRVDSQIFVSIAREEGLCAFSAGPAAEEVEIDKATFNFLADQWRMIEPATVQMVRRLDGKPEGMRLACDIKVLRMLLRERTQPDHARIFLLCITKTFTVPAILAPKPRAAPASFIAPPPPAKGQGPGYGIQKGVAQAGLILGRGGGFALSEEDKEEEVKAGPRVVKSMIKGLLDTDTDSPAGPPPKPSFYVSDEDE